MSQMPPYPMPFRPPRTSAAAVASLVMGLLGCLPFITGILAIITGIVGVSVTGRLEVKGRGMAIAGLILGILSFLSWTGISLGAWRWWVVTTPQRALASQFMSDLAQGNTSAAAALSTSNVTTVQLNNGERILQVWGPVQRTRIVFANPAGEVNGMIFCPNNTVHTFTVSEVQQSAAWKVSAFVLVK